MRGLHFTKVDIASGDVMPCLLIYHIVKCYLLKGKLKSNNYS